MDECVCFMYESIFLDSKIFKFVMIDLFVATVIIYICEYLEPLFSNSINSSFIIRHYCTSLHIIYLNMAPLSTSTSTSASTSTSTTDANHNGKNQPPSSFIWQDTKAFNERLKSFHPNSESDYNNHPIIFSLPIDISPIICSRFGWMKKQKPPLPPLQNNTTQKQQQNKNDENPSLLLTCQNTTKCNGVICIKFHPLLSFESKRKLTYTYREMLATCHSQECLFKYDALSWLKKMDVVVDTRSSQRENNANDDDNEALKFVVPPYLIYLSRDYEMLETYSSYYQNNIMSNSSIHSSSSSSITIITEYILKEAQRMAKCFGKYHMMEVKTNQESTRLFLNEKSVVQQMMDIIATSSSTSASRSTTLNVTDILQKIVSQFNTKLKGSESTSKSNNNSNSTEENAKQEKFGFSLKRLRDALYNNSEEKDCIDEKEDLQSCVIQEGVLLLSIFGWRLCDDDELRTSSDITIPSSAPLTTPMQYVRCNLCLNCSPVPHQFLSETPLQDNSDSENINNPPAKRRRFNDENNQIGVDVDDSTIKEDSRQYKFDLINSHRYYCPFVCGFHGSESNIHRERGQIILDEMGSSIPCWEIVWNCIVQSALHNLETTEQCLTPTTAEQWFSAIRDKIRSSIIHF